MAALTPSVTWLLASLTVTINAFEVFVLVLIGYALIQRKSFAQFLKAKPLQLIAQNGRLLAWLVAFTAMSGSLFYSEIAGFTPCMLCWYQRILMYPLVLLLGMAIVRNEKTIIPYVKAQAGLGAIIALYHYFLQRGGPSIVPCSATIGYSESCSQSFTMSYGYITIPFMALSAFVGIIVLLHMWQVNFKKS